MTCNAKSQSLRKTKTPANAAGILGLLPSAAPVPSPRHIPRLASPFQLVFSARLNKYKFHHFFTSNLKGFSKNPSRFNVNPHSIHVKPHINFHKIFSIFHLTLSIHSRKSRECGADGRPDCEGASPERRFQARRRPGHGPRFQRFVPAVGSSWAEREEQEGDIADLKVSDLEGLN